VNGIKTRTDLGTLNMSDVPIVMVELGNMKNSADAARMTSSTGRDRYAAALVDGIRRFLGR
jgi:N-acetylmuramoyl-L-alanine amidase